MPDWVKETREIIGTTLAEFFEDDCMSMAAALSFYTMFSLPPLLLIVVTAISAVFPYSRERVSGEVVSQINSLVGVQTGEQIVGMLERVGQTGPSTSATVIGIGILVFAATSVLAQLQSSMNIAWQVEPDPEQGGLRNFLLKRVLSLAMLVAIAFLLLVSLLVSTLLEAFHQTIEAWFASAIAVYLVRAANLVFSFLVITFLFGAIYKVLPDAKITWRDVSVGAVVSALLFVVGKLLISIYLGRSNIGSTYGAASALAITLIWVYYASLIVFLGAEFTQVWSRRHGTGLRPIRGAIRTVRRSQRVRPGQRLPPESKERREGKLREDGPDESDSSRAVRNRGEAPI
jgi:membrane protein